MISQVLFPLRAFAAIGFALVSGLAVAQEAVVDADDPAPAAEPAEVGAEVDVDEANAVDGLGQRALQDAFDVLNRGYIHRDALDDLELNRSALQGLLERMEFGARIFPAGSDAKDEAAELPTIVHQPDPAIIYVLPGRADRDALDGLRAGLTGAEGAEVLLLDLRGDDGGLPFANAANLLDLLLPRGERLFEVKRPEDARGEVFVSKVEPVWAGEVFALVSPQSGANAEIAAAVLQSLGVARVIGGRTRGAAVRYEQAVIDGGVIIEYAVAEALLPDGRSFYRQGVIPDLPLAGVTALVATSEDEVAAILNPQVRPRFNEAALVAGTFPELGYKLARSAGEATEWDEEAKADRGISAAYDLIRSHRFLLPAAADQADEADGVAKGEEESVAAEEGDTAGDAADPEGETAPDDGE